MGELAGTLDFAGQNERERIKRPSLLFAGFTLKWSRISVLRLMCPDDVRRTRSGQDDAFF